MIIFALKDAWLTSHDIFLTYIDFRNAFGFINHAKLLAIMEDLGSPEGVVELVGNIYMNSTTAFHGSHFGTPPPKSKLVEESSKDSP